MIAMKQWSWVLSLVFFACFFPNVEAREPSPAGGGFLKLPDIEDCVLAEDSPFLDERIQTRFTIEFWIRFSRPLEQMNSGLFGAEMWSVLTKRKCYELRMGGSAFGDDRIYPRIGVFDEESGGCAIHGDLSYKNGAKWHHIVIQADLPEITFYFDGVRSAVKVESKTSKMANNSEPLKIGFGVNRSEITAPTTLGDWTWTHLDKPLGVSIDELRISDIPRYRNVIRKVDRRFNPDAHTMALWHFDEVGACRFKDSSGHGNTLHTPNCVFGVSKQGKLAMTWGQLKQKR